jgi:hypothetical protein
MENKESSNQENIGSGSPELDSNKDRPTTKNSATGFKTIQPSESFIKEMSGVAVAPKIPEPNNSSAEPVNPNVHFVSQDSTSPAKNNPPETVNPENVYPTPAPNLLNPDEVPTNVHNKNWPEGEPLDFIRGYKLGSNIFWTELIVSFIAGIVFYLLSLAIIQAKNTDLDLIFGTIEELAYLFLAIYIPYKIVKEDSVVYPFWTTILGISTSSIFIVPSTVFWYYFILFGTRHAASFTFLRSTNSLIIADVSIFILILIASYFICKLSYGLAFFVVGRIKKPNVIRAVSAVSFIIVISLIFAMSLLLKNHTDNLIKSERINESKTVIQSST